MSAISACYGIGPLFVSVCHSCNVKPLELARGRNWSIAKHAWTTRKTSWKAGVCAPDEMAHVAAAIVQLKNDEKRTLLERINAGLRTPVSGGPKGGGRE